MSSTSVPVRLACHNMAAFSISPAGAASYSHRADPLPFVLDRDCTRFEGDFDDYRDELLARLEDDTIVEVRRLRGCRSI